MENDQITVLETDSHRNRPNVHAFDEAIPSKEMEFGQESPVDAEDYDTEGAPDVLCREAQGLKGRSVLGDLFWSCVCVANSLFLLRF